MLAGVEHEDGTRSRVAMMQCSNSVSVATTFQEELAKVGVLFMPISEALQKQPELVKKYLGTVVPISDNFFATLNSAVLSDGSLSACRKASGLRACWQLTAAADDFRGDDTRAFSGLTESAGFSLCWICDSTFVSNRHGGCDGQAIFSGLA